MHHTPRIEALEAVAAHYRRECPVRRAMADVSEITGVSIAEMLGPSRVKHIAEARQFAYLLARKSGVTLEAIGEAMARAPHDSLGWDKGR